MNLHNTRTFTVRRCSAVIGGSALVALAAAGIATGQESGGGAVAKSSTMTLGATTTVTSPPNVPATPMATPMIKGPAPLPSEEEAAK